ncbi:penicillin-binding protein 2 [Dehalobacterium formicoaceticum]|uniref:penicillin-binding protein 2 n=1 Tax=Dehalobacterium formicoaceticum TaxID=51515 RepID=UPI001FA8DC6C|nr:penicillin-binding protein 2 [Dehalobacterium formicoaceticum]
MKDRENVKKLNIFFGVIVVIFIVLGLRLFQLQVVQADAYAHLSDKNKFRITSIAARRGNIYDRNKEVLATSKPVFTISLTGGEIEEKESVAALMAEILQDPEITQESILQSLEDQSRRYEPVVIKRLPYDEGIQMVSRIEEKREDLPGVVIREEPMRYYPQGELAGHIIGTVGLINQEELETLEEYNYGRNDWIGKTGLEKTFERFEQGNKEIGLRGKHGADQVEVNAKHQPVSTWSHKDPIPGNSLMLTIDAKLQSVMETSIEETLLRLQKQRPKAKAGAGVLIDVKTGAILAMASAPYLNPNDFANGLSPDKVSYYWDEKLKPTFNRAIAGTYPPGSTFKPMTGLAALASGKISPLDTVYCGPSNWAKPRARCTGTHGNVNLYRAMAVSCNTYFQEMGQRIGIDQLHKTGQELGLGQLTGIELPGEATGLLPSKEWKEASFTGWESTWRIYDTYFMSMGQGYNLYTPLQLANYVATIANGGTRMKPYLVDKIISSDGETVLTEFQPTVAGKVDATDQMIDEIKKAMRAVTEPGGTAYSLFKDFPSSIGVAAKTGTAQTGLPGDDNSKDYHGVFVAFAPYDDPEVAFAGLMEYGYHGGSSAGLVAKAVFEEYFKLKRQPIPDTLPSSME